MNGVLGIISGSGLLPQALAEAEKSAARPYRVVGFEGLVPAWIEGHPMIQARFEKIGALFADLKAAGVTDVVFAGGMARPTLDPTVFDAGFHALMPRLMPALAEGDDATLRVILEAFEAEGFTIRAAHDLLSDLTVAPGVLTKTNPSEADLVDVARAAEIVAELSRLDIGQGAVVAQGLCFATETLQGTDRMLAFAAEGLARLRPDPEGVKGVLYKAPKRAQDRRVDLPAIGPDTVAATASAGLAGIAIEAGGVMILDRVGTLAAADAAGLFLVARDAG